MQFSQERDLSSYTIRSYSIEAIRVVTPFDRGAESGDGPQEVVLTESFIMTPEQLIRNWPPQQVDDLNADHFETITQLQPEVILLGTGESLSFPEQALTLNIMAQGIGVEVMDSAAACRTYNIIMNEGRNVAVAMII